ncbi:hypothetical protein [Rubritalea tangerina]|uniref:hypothetical protein n=1 Tax=Rubritalea tangerina TaxID=430798 RepID=UPI00360C5249
MSSAHHFQPSIRNNKSQYIPPSACGVLYVLPKNETIDVFHFKLSCFLIGVITGWSLRPIIEEEPPVPLAEYGGTFDLALVLK